MRGHAGIYSLQAGGEARLFWSEDTLFASNVAGMNVLDDQLLATIRYKCSQGIESRTSSSKVYDKRGWRDENSSIDSALLYIDRSGRVASRTEFSAGLTVWLRGVEMIGRRPVLYSTVVELMRRERHLSLPIAI